MHFMYGFATVTPDGSGSYKLASNDPNADHPSGNVGQDRLCDPRCNDPTFTPNWSDPGGLRCDWPCGAGRVMRGYEGMNVAQRAKNPNIKTLISVGGWNFNDCAASPSDTFGQGSAISADAGDLMVLTWTGSIQSKPGTTATRK